METRTQGNKLGRSSPSHYVGTGTLGRISPCHDLGYHTLVTRQTPTPTRDRARQTPTPTRDRTTTPSPWSHDIRGSPFPALDLSALSSCPRSSPRPQLPQVPPQQTQIESTDQLLATYKGKRITKSSPFDRLSDELVVKVMSFLPTNCVCQCARVCRRWYVLAWDPRLWTKICLSGDNIHADRAIKQITRLLARDSGGCVHVEKVIQLTFILIFKYTVCCYIIIFQAYSMNSNCRISL